MSTPDADLTTVTRPFVAAMGRMCMASNVPELEDERSNMLSQLYRLGELCKRRMGSGPFRAALVQLPEARAALWIRTFDTHGPLVTAAVGDVFSDFFTNLYGVLVWTPLASLALTEEKGRPWHGRDAVYQAVLENRAVLDTLRLAFDQMGGLIGSPPLNFPHS